MDFFPAFFNISNKHCLVTGGGKVATRKVTLLLKAGANVTVIAPELCAELKQKQLSADFQHIRKTVELTDLHGFLLVIAATNNEAVNQSVSEYCHKHNIPVNVVDNAAQCSFIVPSILDRSPVMIAVSTGGTAPVLARQLRSRLETMIPAPYGKLATLAESFREQVKNKFPGAKSRRYFWESLFQGPVAELVFSGREDEAHAKVTELINTNSNEKNSTGEVYLVGVGPGDPDLLTFKALRLMQQADVILYDRLVSREILEMCRRDADLIYVGKKKANHSVPQPEINQLLVDHALLGKRVCRLKGGDPFIFGRGGEEIEQLVDAGINFQVVPGITAATGCSAYSGIPLTHRDYAQSVIFITGHQQQELSLDWEQLVKPNQTVVFYMGITSINTICKQLIQHGMSPEMPAALVERGTTPNQRLHISNIKSLPEVVQNNKIKPPALTIIGEVVALNEKLNWFKPDNFQAAQTSRKEPE